MDYRKSAEQVIEKIGGRENIVSAAHCATRLRLVVADNNIIKKEDIEEIDGVKGCFIASGQLQVIFGTGTVDKVYDEFIQLAGISVASASEVKQQAAAKANIFMRLIRTLGDVFVPIIPAIVACGLIMGLTEALTFMNNNGFIAINTNGYVFQIISLKQRRLYIPAHFNRFFRNKNFRRKPLFGCGFGNVPYSHKSPERLYGSY